MPEVPLSQGRVRLIEGLLPTAAANCKVSQTVRTRWKVKSVSARLVCDANVATRNAKLKISVGGVTIGEFVGRATQAANETIRYTWYGASTSPSTDKYESLACEIPIDLIVNDETDFETMTENIQVGDQWTKMAILCEEWIEPLA